VSKVSVLQAGLACCGVESSSVDLVSGAWEQTESVSKLSAAQHITDLSSRFSADVFGWFVQLTDSGISGDHFSITQVFMKYA
jgi:hypothetical protein